MNSNPNLNDGWLLFDENVGILKNKNSKRLSLRLKINNLLNKSYRNYLNRMRYYSHELGRNIIVGLNYKDKLHNAKKYINGLGNPYSTILLDGDGTRAIEWGAIGVPETFLIYENKIIKRYIGPLNLKLVDEIKNYLRWNF